MREQYDAVVVGAGPNGLAAAITLARAGWGVLLVEANDQVGGGSRTMALTLPGFLHDTCSTVQSMVEASPFLRSVPMADHGLELAYPPLPLAHPLDGGRAVVMARSVEETAEGLGRDGPAYRRLLGPLVRRADAVVAEILGPPPFFPKWPAPRHLLPLAGFGLRGLWPSTVLARTAFKDEEARALFAGVAAHAIQPLSNAFTGAFGLTLAFLAHARGWPFARGGSQRVADALAAEFEKLGGEIRTGWRVTDIDELPPARHVLFDLTPRQLLAIAGTRFPAAYRARLARYRYGPGVFKLDWALDGPVPWTNEACGRAGTVHVIGGMAEAAAAEAASAAGRVPEKPYVLLCQPSVADPTRAPEGKHTLWAYCHVPNGSDVDMTAAVEDQIERFAPGFRDRILARHTMGPAQMEAHDANYIGGDINGGVQDLRQLFTRPVARYPVYSTPDPNVWLCSSSTPPGGGVHGMCGASAATAVLRRERRRAVRR
jgi:phytoene dehydrogenase-like protein